MKEKSINETFGISSSESREIKWDIFCNLKGSHLITVPEVLTKIFQEITDRERYKIYVYAEIHRMLYND